MTDNKTVSRPRAAEDGEGMKAPWPAVWLIAIYAVIFGAFFLLVFGWPKP